ncbi:MAG: hypothetical protein D6756_11665 [Cyanobacteria bacterium J083]|nr:MAG: hypothetical protein D6756_11665 [Cyanobacteria bacterium J083]
MSSVYDKPPEKSVSAVFKDQKQVEQVIKKLIDRGVPKDNISVIGRNFQSEARITGFVTKKDLILQGLKEGAIYGSLFGSFLSLLTGIGVLFIPFVGAVVAAGPLGAALLGAASGAIAGSVGAGLASALMTLGMPEDKAAIYQTRVEAGEFLVVVEVPAEKAGEIFLLLQNAGGEEVATTDMKIPHQPEGKLSGKEELSPEIKADLSEKAQETFVKEYNNSLAESNDETKAMVKAWSKVESEFEPDEQGKLSKAKT